MASHAPLRRGPFDFSISRARSNVPDPNWELARISRRSDRRKQPVNCKFLIQEDCPLNGKADDEGPTRTVNDTPWPALGKFDNSLYQNNWPNNQGWKKRHKSEDSEES